MSRSFRPFLPKLSVSASELADSLSLSTFNAVGDSVDFMPLGFSRVSRNILLVVIGVLTLPEEEGDDVSELFWVESDRGLVQEI